MIINKVKNERDMKNIALLDSSLTVSANAGRNANFLNTPRALTGYHKTSYLDAQLKRIFGGTFSTFNLSAPGEVPSDAYLYLKSMVTTQQRPEVVIYGVAPRDFIDSTMTSPSDSEAFGYLKRIISADEVASGFYRNWLGKLDLWLQHAVYLYGYSLDMQMYLTEAGTQILDIAAPRPYTNKPFTWWDRVSLLPKYKFGEVLPRSFVAAPLTREKAKAEYSDNTREYIERYKMPDSHTFKTQFGFLRQLAAYCQRERIELIVVNMPISLWNVQLLKPEHYYRYLFELRKTAEDYNFTLLNAADWQRYQREDFHDSVHLNAFGGTKFFDDLVRQIRQNPRAASAMDMAGQELSRRRSVAALKTANPN